MAKQIKYKMQPEAEATTVKASFNINPLKLKQLRYIAVVDEITQTEIIDQLLTDFIEKWEKKHGEIPKR